MRILNFWGVRLGTYTVACYIVADVCRKKSRVVRRLEVLSPSLSPPPANYACHSLWLVNDGVLSCTERAKTTKMYCTIQSELKS